MRKLKVAIIDILAKNKGTQLFSRFLQTNLASIMPQVIATWCEREGHDVGLACYVGHEILIGGVPEDPDVVFFSTFTTTAHHAYALSNKYRSAGAVTVLGGPHARAYPEDAERYFDYVVGFADRALIGEILRDPASSRPAGIHLTTGKQISALPGVRERWKYINQVLKQQSVFTVVNMLSSLGCPYSCNFCVDSVVPYRQFDSIELQEDLRFIQKKLPRPVVAWHDPNFGVRYDEILDAIEEVVPPGKIRFVGESSLALLAEERLKRLKDNGFVMLMPGIESWFDFGGKANVGHKTGYEKVRQVAEQVNTVMRYVPIVQANFIFGLDLDQGAEPFELTKRFVDLAPGTHPTLSLNTSFGGSAPHNIVYQRERRIVRFPFHFLNGSHWTNVRPLHYEWIDLYDRISDLYRYSFSARAIARRAAANRGPAAKSIQFLRALSTEGRGRFGKLRTLRGHLAKPVFRSFMHNEGTQVPPVLIDTIRRDLGPLWEWLPEGGCEHDAYACLKSARHKESHLSRKELSALSAV